MPHRNADVISYCAVCEEQASQGCKRCGIDLCTSHAPVAENRCSRCENEYALVLRKKNLFGINTHTDISSMQLISRRLVVCSVFAFLAMVVPLWLDFSVGALYLFLFGMSLLLAGGVGSSWAKTIAFYEREIRSPFIEPKIRAKKIEEERTLFLLETPDVLARRHARK